jgi:hypothetical protein
VSGCFPCVNCAGFPDVYGSMEECEEACACQCRDDSECSPSCNAWTRDILDGQPICVRLCCIVKCSNCECSCDGFYPPEFSNNLSLCAGCCLVCELPGPPPEQCPEGFFFPNGTDGLCQKYFPTDCSNEQIAEAASQCSAAGGGTVGPPDGPCPPPPPPPPT